MLVLRMTAGDVSTRQSTDGRSIHASTLVSLSSLDGSFHGSGGPHGLVYVQSVAASTHEAETRSIREMQTIRLLQATCVQSTK